MARELDCDRSELLNWRHRLQDLAFGSRDRTPLDDAVLEADEAFQNAGEKKAFRTSIPTPRRRANKIPGHGAWDNGRPPVRGVVGRESGRLRLTVVEHSDGATLVEVVGRATWPMVTVNADEWQG